MIEGRKIPVPRAVDRVEPTAGRVEHNLLLVTAPQADRSRIDLDDMRLEHAS